jgi:hypothetical protein
MNTEELKMLGEILRRWHVQPYDGLTLQQASFDIGYLAGLIMKLEGTLAEGKRRTEGKE